VIVLPSLKKAWIILLIEHDSPVEMPGGEVGPQHPQKNQTRDRTLPQEKVAQPIFSRSSDQQINWGRLGEFLLEKFFCDIPRSE